MRGLWIAARAQTEFLGACARVTAGGLMLRDIRLCPCRRPDMVVAPAGVPSLSCDRRARPEAAVRDRQPSTSQENVRCRRGQRRARAG